jgi:CheY-like chemotaxis protein
VRSIIVRTLERLGYSVQAAGDGSEALSMFLDGAVDELSLLVTDIVMPHLGGTELATRLRETLPDLRVLYVSGYADRYPEDIADSSRAVLLAKPFLPSDLAREVRTLLDHDRSAAE